MNNPTEVHWKSILDNQSKISGLAERFKLLSKVRAFKRRMKSSNSQLPHYTKILTLIAKEMRPKVYIEIGIFVSETFNQVGKFSDQAIGVDIEKSAINFIQLKNSHFICGSSKDAANHFKVNSKEFELAFIDANHSKEAVVEDFASISPFLSENGLILLHDTWPINESMSQIEYSHSAWEAVDLLRLKFPDFSFITLPISPGLTFCQRTAAKPFWTKNRN